MLKKLSSSTKNFNRDHFFEDFHKLNKQLLYTGQIEAAEKYRSGPIVGTSKFPKTLTKQ